MEEEQEIRVEDLQLVEIQELLAEHGIELDDQATADLAQFVQEAGGLEAALEVLDQLQRQPEAA